MVKDFKPVFIVGNPRSGTTLLATLLSRNSELSIPSETQFMCKVLPCGTEINTKILSHYSLVEELFTYYRIHDFEIDKDSFYCFFRNYSATYKDMFRALLEYNAILEGKRFTGEKSPIHLLYVPLILKWYPKAKIICIVRDGRDVVQSLKKVPWGHDSLLRYCADWNYSSMLIRKYKHEYGHSVKIIQYDDLVMTPEESLKSLCDYIGISFETEMLSTLEGSKVVAKWESGWKKKATGEIDVSRLGAWRNNASDSDLFVMNLIMKKWLKYWGYDCSYLAKVSYKMKIKKYLESIYFRGYQYIMISRLREGVKVFLCKTGIIKIYKETVR